TIKSTSARKKIATNASNRQTPACRTRSAAFAGSAIPAASRKSEEALLKKPSLGSDEKTFRYPAENVTMHMNASGKTVTKRYFALCTLIRIVVPRQSATTDSNWLARPKSGQSELIPPSGSMTPTYKNQPQAAT